MSTHGATPTMMSAISLKNRGLAALMPVASQAQLDSAYQVLAGRITLVGETTLLPDQPDWTWSPSRDKEWLIALHKHPFAVDLALAYRVTDNPAYLWRWVQLSESWLASIGTGYITASDAQVEAKRLEHWCLALLTLGASDVLLEHSGWCMPEDFLERLLERMAQEAHYIMANLKPVRNHRTFQLYSVFLAAALFPELTDADSLRQQSYALLVDNLLTDLLPDGVQVELSSHYHQLVLECATRALALARWCGLTMPPLLEQRIRHGLEFCMWVQWPDGSLPLLGDSDDGEQQLLLRLGAELFDDPELRWGSSLGAVGNPPARSARAFTDAGYIVLSSGWGHGPASYAERQHVVYDCGPLGAGSHCHYDLFSFTYYAGGVPLVIDPGRYTYDSAPDTAGIDWRYAFKRTAAHNTMQIAGRDQTRYHSKWLRDQQQQPKGGPKHGPAPTLMERTWFLGQVCSWIDATASSTEYSPTHRRVFFLIDRSYLLIIDIVSLSEREPQSADLHFHLGTALQGQVYLAGTADGMRASSPLLDLLVAGGPGITGQVLDGWASRSYGQKQVAPVLHFSQCAARSMLFASVLAPTSSVKVERVTLYGSIETGQLRCTVRGYTGQTAWVDELLLATTPQSAQYASADLTFVGRHLLSRRDAQGRLRWLTAHAVESLCYGLRTTTNQEVVEWTL